MATTRKTDRRSTRSDGGSKVTPFVMGAIAGGIVGAALALLYAPAAGEELRRGVGEKFDDITDGINAILKSAKTSAEKMLDEGRGMAEDIIEDIEDEFSGSDDHTYTGRDADRSHDEMGTNGADTSYSGGRTGGA